MRCSTNTIRKTKGLFCYEQYFPEYEADEKKLASLTVIYEGIAEELDEKANAGIIDEYTKLTIMDMSKKALVSENRKN